MYQNLEKLLNTVKNADECQYMPDATLNASYPAADNYPNKFLTVWLEIRA